MENDLKTPVIILTRDPQNGSDLMNYLTGRFPDRNMNVVVVGTAQEMMDHLTHKHYNIVVVDYDKELYEEAERMVYEKKRPMAISMFLSTEYDVQFILRKPEEHYVQADLILTPEMSRFIIKDKKDHESVARLMEELFAQGKMRKGYNQKNYIAAAALMVFLLIVAIIIF